MTRLSQFLILCAAFLFSTVVLAGPWLLPGDLSVKSDIDLLADAGYIKAPVMTWPIAWVNIGPSLLSPDNQHKIQTAPEDVQLAYQRILTLYNANTQLNVPQYTTTVSGSTNLNPFPTFQTQPRADFEPEASAAYQTADLAADLDMSYYNSANQDATNPVHFDNSYAYAFPGNWAVGVDKMDRWWGPGYSDSMILSQNAAPLPTITVQRMEADPFETKWLSWIGPWTLTSSLSEDGPAYYSYPTGVDDILYWFTNISFRPLESLQFDVSRNVLFSGSQRPMNGQMFLNLITVQNSWNTSTGNNAPGSETWEIGTKWSLAPVFNIPMSLYQQTIFNNDIASASSLYVPDYTTLLLGTNFWLHSVLGTFTTYGEFEYSVQKKWWFWGSPAASFPGTNIVPNIYGGQYPYTYYNNLFGSPLGSEAQGYTLGEILNETNGNSDTATLRFLRLNMYNWGVAGTPGYPFQKQDVIWASVGRTQMLPYHLGSLSGQLGYLKSVEGSGLASGPSTTLTWSESF